MLRMIKLNKSNRDFTADRDIALRSAENHVHNVLTKLAVASGAEAAASARTEMIG